MILHTYKTEELFSNTQPDQVGTLMEELVADAMGVGFYTTASMVENGMISKEDEVVLQKEHSIDISYIPNYTGYEVYSIDDVLSSKLNVQVKFQPRATAFKAVNLEKEQRLFSILDADVITTKTCFGKKDQPAYTVYVLAMDTCLLINTKKLIDLSNQHSMMIFPGSDTIYYPGTKDFTHSGKVWGVKLPLKELIDNSSTFDVNDSLTTFSYPRI